MRQIHRQFASLLARHPRQIAGTLLSFIAAALLNAVAIANLLPLVVLLKPEGSTEHPLALAIAKLYEGIGLQTTPLVLISMIAGLIVLRAAIQWVAMIQIGYASATIGSDLRTRLLHALLRARWEYQITQPLGFIQSALGREARIAAESVVALCRVLASTIQVAVYLLVALIISWPVTLLAVVAGVSLTWLLSGFIRSIRCASRDVNIQERHLTKTIQEVFAAAKSIKAMNREPLVEQLATQDVHSLRDAVRRLIVSRESRLQLEEPALMCGAIVGGLLIFATTGSLETLVVLLVVFERSMRRIVALQRDYQAVAQAEHAYASVRELVADAEAHRERIGGERPPSFRHQIKFESVTFGFLEPPVLRDVSLTIPVRRLVVLTGPSGAGKTSVADLIIGLIQPSAGVISLDQVPLNTIDLNAWRQQVGYVPQDAPFFHDSIVANVTLKDPLLTRADATAALQLAGAWAFVSALPQGIDTNVGERGARLSGGERQRIALARALVRQPSLLILDEATNSLDAGTERAIAATLRRLANKVTILAITHGSALTELADTTYVVNTGRVEPIVETGTRARG